MIMKVDEDWHWMVDMCLSIVERRSLPEAIEVSDRVIMLFYVLPMRSWCWREERLAEALEVSDLSMYLWGPDAEEKREWQRPWRSVIGSLLKTLNACLSMYLWGPDAEEGKGWQRPWWLVIGSLLKTLNAYLSMYLWGPDAEERRGWQRPWRWQCHQHRPATSPAAASACTCSWRTGWAPQTCTINLL